MRCGLTDRHIAPAAGRPRRLVRVPKLLPSVPRDLRSRALLTASAFRPAWVSTLAGQAAVDRFYFSALAPVRPTTSPLHTPRCPQTFGHLRRLLRHWLCSIRRRKPERLVGASCRTEHRSENWAIPSLCRATPSATSERLVELLGSSPIFLSFVASCVSFQLRLLPSTGVTRLQRHYEPLRHPSRPGLSLTSCRLIQNNDHRWDFSCCVWSPLPACRRQYHGRTDGNLFAHTIPSTSAFPETGAGRLLR